MVFIRTILQILLSLVAVFIAAKYLPGIFTDDTVTIVILAAVLALLNILLRPLVQRLNFAFTVFTVGLVVLLINAAFIKLTASFLDGFSVNGWTAAFLFSLVITSLHIITDRLLVRKSY